MCKSKQRLSLGKICFGKTEEIKSISESDADNLQPEQGADKKELPTVLRLLSFNVHVGINTRRYHHYITRSWQHVLPHTQRQHILNQVANLITDYDIVALQEVDGGSLRSNYVNQVEYLARIAHFPFLYQQVNRNFGRIAKHSNGILSRYQPAQTCYHSLPGFPGRGAIELQFGEKNELVVVAMHLALSRRRQNKQLAYIRSLVAEYKYVVLMGDMNVGDNHLLLFSPLKDLGIKSATPNACTFPSWKPEKCLDHILLSEALEVQSTAIPVISASDHLPVAVTIKIP